MPGYGVANPGSLIGFVFLFVAIQLQHGQCAFPNSLLLFVQARGVFLGACTFIAACLISCLCPTRHLAQDFTTANHTAITSSVACGAAAHLVPGKGRVGPRGGRHVLWLWVGCLFGGVRFVLLLHACSLCSLGAACCWFACLLCAVLRFCLASSVC